ncbi:MAG: hypothetical protein ACREJK_06765, partial [Candidatus Methylomirabilales bacterium]
GGGWGAALSALVGAGRSDGTSGGFVTPGTASLGVSALGDTSGSRLSVSGGFKGIGGFTGA